MKCIYIFAVYRRSNMLKRDLFPLKVHFCGLSFKSKDVVLQCDCTTLYREIQAKVFFFSEAFFPHTALWFFFHLLSLNLLLKHQHWKSQIRKHSQLRMVERGVNACTTSRGLQTLFHSLSSSRHTSMCVCLVCFGGSKYRHVLCLCVKREVRCFRGKAHGVLDFLSIRRSFPVNRWRNFRSFRLSWDWTNTLPFSFTISPWNEIKWYLENNF